MKTDVIRKRQRHDNNTSARTKKRGKSQSQGDIPPPPPLPTHTTCPPPIPAASYPPQNTAHAIASGSSNAAYDYATAVAAFSLIQADGLGGLPSWAGR